MFVPVQISAADEYCARRASPGVPLTVTPAPAVTEQAPEPLRMM